MADTNLTLDYYKMKVFLYKYTPSFSIAQTDPTEVTSPLQAISRYHVDLDEKYFTKYDITEYVSSYNFSQEINANTYDWSVTLQNPILTFKQINDTLKVEGIIRWDSNNIQQLADYETLGESASKFFYHVVESDYIVGAKRHRGQQSKSFDTKDSPASDLLTRIDSTNTTAPGLRLSDLVQPYDMISVFLYRGKTPLEDLTGAEITDGDSGLTVFVPTADGLTPISKKQLQKESILLSRTSLTDGIQTTLFNNEFIGFVMAKTFSSAIGEVDTMNISGNGVTRLFGSTRRIIKSSFFQKSIFSINETSGQGDQVSAFHSNFVGLKLHEIFEELFRSCYRISFENFETLPNAVPTGSFLDISSLKVNNKKSTNMFSIPPYLMSLVLKHHGYKYRDVKDAASIDALITKASTERPRTMVAQVEYQDNTVVDTDILISSGAFKSTDPNSLDLALTDNPNLQVTNGSLDPVYFSSELDSVRPYFKFFEAVLANYNPALSTPYEIIDDLKANTFLEFIDSANGHAVIRVPQYNDTTQTIFSSSVDVLSSSYNFDITGLISRQTVKYAADALAQISPIEFLAYTNGKLLLQFGQLESAADANPNYRTEKETSATLADNKKSGIIHYARYLLRLRNAALSTGNFSCGYDPRISVGRTFFDEKLSKFGYITSVTKSVASGGTASTNFTLSYVRDAVWNGTTLSFQYLETMLDIAQGFTKSAIPLPTTDVDQTGGLGSES